MHEGQRPSVSPRQSEILSLIACGKTDKEIAKALGIRRRTVRTHLERLYEHHGLHSRVDAAVLWVSVSAGQSPGTPASAT